MNTKRHVGRPSVDISIDYLKGAHEVYLKTRSLRQSAKYLEQFGIKLSYVSLRNRFDAHGMKRLKITYLY